MPKVSIVTVCYNELNNIQKTLESVIRQTYQQKEYVVVDGRSSDGTLDIINRYSRDIDIVVSEPDEGIYNAMNKGIRECRGEYVYFLNGGDYLRDENVLAEILKQDLTEDIVYGDMVWDWGSGRLETRQQPAKLGYGRFIATSLWQPACLTKRALFEKFGGFNEKYKICGDYDFFLRVIFGGDVSTRYLPFVFSVFSTEGISRSRDRGRYLQHYRERKAVQKEHLPLPYLIVARARHFYIREKRRLLGQY